MATPESPCLKEKLSALFQLAQEHLVVCALLLALRDQLAKLSLWVAPTQFALSKAHEAFAEDGSFKDEEQAKRIKAVIADMAAF